MDLGFGVGVWGFKFTNDGFNHACHRKSVVCRLELRLKVALQRVGLVLWGFGVWGLGARFYSLGGKEIRFMFAKFGPRLLVRRFLMRLQLALPWVDPVRRVLHAGAREPCQASAIRYQARRALRAER